MYVVVLFGCPPPPLKVTVTFWFKALKAVVLMECPPLVLMSSTAEGRLAKVKLNAEEICDCCPAIPVGGLKQIGSFKRLNTKEVVLSPWNEGENGSFFLKAVLFLPIS